MPSFLFSFQITLYFSLGQGPRRNFKSGGAKNVV